MISFLKHKLFKKPIGLDMFGKQVFLNNYMVCDDDILWKVIKDSNGRYCLIDYYNKFLISLKLSNKKLLPYNYKPKKVQIND